ncbi:MAG: alpha/beta hydrolase [Kordiimonadales bacterium]|nr:MAG: alpha/beta hydrolase [Kordiimonadales bacterium]
MIKFRYLTTIAPCLIVGYLLTAPAVALPSPATTDPIDVDPKFPPTTIELTITSGGKQMNGHMYLANGSGPHPTVILLHGFPGNEKNLDVAQALRRAGFNALYFHHRGAWGSEGEFGARNNTEDAAAAADYVRANATEQRSDPDKISFFGHSLGGFTALYSGAIDQAIRCTVAVTPSNLTLSIKSRIEAGFDVGASAVQRNVPGLNSYSAASLFREVAADYAFFDLTNVMGRYNGRPLMIISGDKDRAVPLAVQLPLAAAAKKAGAKPFIHLIMDADHVFSWNRIAFTENAVNWMTRNCR